MTEHTQQAQGAARQRSRWEDLTRGHDKPPGQTDADALAAMEAADPGLSRVLAGAVAAYVRQTV